VAKAMAKMLVPMMLVLKKLKKLKKLALKKLAKAPKQAPVIAK
jgi:hypothetical protein